jgi:uncharacterized protein (DUF1501 family)
MKRSDFIKVGALASASMLTPRFLQAHNGLFVPVSGNRKKLVVIQLSGGNDGLNTFIPYRDDQYYSLRPQLAIPKSQVLRVDDHAGFHPELGVFRALFDSGELTVINSVGYPNPNRSHFRSMDIWQSASASDQYLTTGWLGRYLDAACSGSALPSEAVELDDSLSLALKGTRIKGLAMSDPQKMHRLSETLAITSHLGENHHHGHPQAEYLYKTLTEATTGIQCIYEKSKVHRSTVTYPAGAAGKKMKTIAELIIGGAPSSVYYLSLGGFDTHVGQAATQSRLFRQLSASLEAFTGDLRSNGALDDTLILLFSEFGRRVAENAGKGTDHGTANPVFLISGGLKKPGRFNEMPDLSNLDEGDLRFTIDFRSIYGSVLDTWFGIDPQVVLDKKITLLPVL